MGWPTVYVGLSRRGLVSLPKPDPQTDVSAALQFRPGHILLVLLGFALAAMGIYTVHAESEAYLAGPTSIARVAAWTEVPVTPGLSVATQKLTLLDCENTLLSPNALALRYLEPATRDKLAPTCRKLAQAITMTSPNQSYAWYVAALASARMSDWSEMNAALHRSQLTGAQSLWIAERRFALSTQQRASLDADAGAAASADLELMLLTNGLQTLVRPYATDAALRQSVGAAIDAMPEAQRSLALSNLVGALGRRENTR